MLIALNTLIYVTVAILHGSLIDIDTRVLVALGAIYAPLIVTQEEWWRIFTALFLHGSMTHLLMNMVSLYIVGRHLEKMVPHWCYLLLYFAAGLFGALISLYVHPTGVAVGASGAIFGIFGALAGVLLAKGALYRPMPRGFLQDFGTVLVINLVIGLVIPSIDLAAHIAGLVVGLIGGFLVARSFMGVLLFGALWLILIRVTVGVIKANTTTAVLL